MRWLGRTSSADMMDEIMLSSRVHDGSETDTETELDGHCERRHRRGHSLHDTALCLVLCWLTCRAETLLITLTRHSTAHCVCGADNSAMFNIKAKLNGSQETFCLVSFIFITTWMKTRMCVCVCVYRIEDVKGVLKAFFQNQN